MVCADAPVLYGHALGRHDGSRRKVAGIEKAVRRCRNGRRGPWLQPLSGVPVLALPVFTDEFRLGHCAEKGAGGGLLGVFTRCFGIGRNGRLPDYRDFPEAARYWGVADVASPGVQPFGVLDLADFSWWNPAWLYVRVGSIAVLSWSMAQVWETLVAEKNVWQPSFRRGSAVFCMVVTVMMLGLLGMDMLGGTGKVVLSMFPVYMIAYVLLVSLAFAVLSAVFLRRLDGGKELPWPRLGGMLTAMVLVKAYIVYSQYMITWYASIPAEMSFYNAAASSGWSGMFAAALVLQLLLPFLILLFPALRRRPSALGAVCAGVLFGSLLEACWMFGPGLGLDPSAWKAWLPLVLLLGGMALICCFSFLGALSVRRVFPES